MLLDLDSEPVSEKNSDSEFEEEQDSECSDLLSTLALAYDKISDS